MTRTRMMKLCACNLTWWMRSTQRLSKGWHDTRTSWQSTIIPKSDTETSRLEISILKKVMGTAKDPTQGKLSPNWEGPYIIASWQRKGTYHLEMLDGRKLQHPWNAEHLRKYYQ